MKEFSAQTGGRYTYVDDIVNLQDLSLAFGELFTECDNFIVSGCAISGNTIAPGFVYLNGKLRRFSGATGITKWPQYIYEQNSTESVSYASGSDKVGRTVYGCSIGQSVPTSLDPVTQKTPVALTINQSGGEKMQDAFIGKYALLLNPTRENQTVSGIVNFNHDIFTFGVINALNGLKLKSGSSTGMIEYINGVKILSTPSTGAASCIHLKDGVGLIVSVGGTERMQVSSSLATFNVPINTGTNSVSIGSIKINGTHIHNFSTASNNGEVNINVVGYNGGTTYSRNTFIGNGKNTVLLAVYGDTNRISLNGVTTIASSGLEGLVLSSTLASNNNSLQKAVVWKDSSSTSIGYVGFIDNTNQYFTVKNTVSEVVVLGKNYVNLGPEIKENGTSLKDKYALKTDMNSALSLKANSDDVYNKIDAGLTFAKLNSGLTQFINSTNTAATLRDQIGALGTSSIVEMTKLSKCLSDMATSEDKKKAIRKNIGAVSANEVQAPLKDTGWKNISGTDLYVRQIGNIVSIQGTTSLKHTKNTQFTIPNSIDPPTYSVYQSVTRSNKVNWSCYIAGGSRDCVVSYCDGSCGLNTAFSITYMV